MRASTLPSEPAGTPGTRSSSSNALAALLGATFLCSQCQHRHRPGSGPAMTCQQAFASSQLDPLTLTWTPKTHQLRYQARYRWRTHNSQWPEANDAPYQELTTALSSCTVRLAFGTATVEELALSDGGAQLSKRHTRWLTEAQAQIAAAQQKAARIAGQLDRLLTVPHPAGPPQAMALPEPPHYRLTPATRAELTRVAGRFNPPGNSGIVGDHLIVQVARRDETRDHIASALRLLNTALDAQTSYSQLYRDQERTVIIDALGLDPAFWRSVDPGEETLWLISQSLQLLRSPTGQHPPTLAAQLALFT